MNAVELLMAEGGETFVYSNVIHIDGITRELSIPVGEENFGVEGDKDVTRKYFSAPKIVGDNIDLSLHNIYVNYVLADEKGNPKSEVIGTYLCEDVTIEDDSIKFSWKLSEQVLLEDGFIAFAIAAKQSVDGVLKTKWYTTPGVGKVKKTIKDGTGIEQLYPDVLDNLVNRMMALEDAIKSGSGGISISVDSELSEESTNPVQNKVITKKVNELSKEIVDVNKAIDDYLYEDVLSVINENTSVTLLTGKTIGITGNLEDLASWKTMYFTATEDFCFC